jgi:hypothetical protein
MLTKIKQWLYQKLANRLLCGVIIKQMETKGYEPGFILHGMDWDYIIPQRRIPRLAEKPYVSKYDSRTPTEHTAIRKRIQRDPSTCRHTKGDRTRPPFVDYNVSSFVFIDGSIQIKCLSCRHVWTGESPDWKEAVRMMNASTNTPMSCEQPIRIVSAVPK